MIEPPETFSQDILDQVEMAYMDAVAQVDAEEYDYVIRRFETTMIKLRTADDWRKEICRTCEILLHLLNLKTARGERIPEEARQYIVAALFYVCSPFDVIGDRIPELGYVDDAHVLNLCLKKLKELCPRVLKKAQANYRG